MKVKEGDSDVGRTMERMMKNQGESRHVIYILMILCQMCVRIIDKLVYGFVAAHS